MFLCCTNAKTIDISMCRKQPMVIRSAIINKSNKTIDNSHNHKFQILRERIEIMKESEGEREGEITNNVSGSC